MILVTMVGMTLLFAFVSSYSENYKAGIGSSVMESLTVEDIWLSPSNIQDSHAVQISVYNAGKIDSTITSVYVDGLKLTDSANGQNFNLKKDVAVGDHSVITLYRDSHSNWQNVHYIFKIATQRGSSFEVTYNPT
jgi:hypothetical protein